MLTKRLIVVIIIIPIGVGFIAAGGWYFTGLIMALLGLASWEFWRMYQAGGLSPAIGIMLPSVLALAGARHIWQFEYSDLILAAAIITAMVLHTLRFSEGTRSQAIDFTITLGGILYVGWLGSYLISIRDLPGGQWWLLLTIPAIGFGDAGAYFIGSRIGKHKMAPHVSPNKSWEGYIAGVIFTILGGYLFASLWQVRYPAITPLHGIIIGSILGILAPLGDLGESMLKRQFGIKDTGRIFPGHGGVLDRLDSWLFGAVIGYYLITFLW